MQAAAPQSVLDPPQAVAKVRRRLSRCRCLAKRRRHQEDLDLEGQKVMVTGTGPAVKSAVLLALDRGATVQTECPQLQRDPEVQQSIESLRLQPTDEHITAGEMLDTDMLVLPALSSWTRQAVEAVERGAPATSGLGFAFEALPPNFPVAAVTGSSGKASVANYCSQFLGMSGLNAWSGSDSVPLTHLALSLRQGADYEAAAVPAPSHQLALAGATAPQAAAVLNCTPEQLDLHGSLARQAAAMCKVFSRMGPSQVAAIPAGDDLVADMAASGGGTGRRAWLGRLPGVRVTGGHAQLMLPGHGDISTLDLSCLPAAGAHNTANAATAALLAASLGVGVSPASLQRTIPLLKAPPHRLQSLGQREGVHFVDDSASCTVESTIAGLQSLHQPTVLLIGGESTAEQDGSLGFAQLGRFVEGHSLDSWCSTVVAYGRDAGRIAHELQPFRTTCLTAGTLADAVELAVELAQPGDAVLLSPACGTGSEFRSRDRRGEVFASLLPPAKSSPTGLLRTQVSQSTGD